MSIKRRLGRLEQAVRPAADWADKPASARLLRLLALMLRVRQRRGKAGAKAAAHTAKALASLRAAIADTPGPELEARCEAALGQAREAMRRARGAGVVP